MVARHSGEDYYPMALNVFIRRCSQCGRSGWQYKSPPEIKRVWAGEKLQVSLGIETEGHPSLCGLHAIEEARRIHGRDWASPPVLRAARGSRQRQNGQV